MRSRGVQRGRSTGAVIVVALVFGITLLVAGAAAAAGSKDQSGDPDAGLSDAQRQQIYASGRAAFESKYEAWVAGLDLSTIDYGQLDREPINALYEPGQPSLAAAEAQATLVVLGTVRSIRPTAFDGTYVTLDVASALKGNASTSLVVHQGGGLRPTPDWKGMFIADSMDAPLMLPQDRVVLFLGVGTRGALEVQSFTGLYQSRLGRIRPTVGNPFAAQFDNVLETDFVAAVRLSAT